MTIENKRTRGYSARRAISEMKNAGQSEAAREAIQSSSLEASEKETLLGQLD